MINGISRPQWGMSALGFSHRLGRIPSPPRRAGNRVRPLLFPASDFLIALDSIARYPSRGCGLGSPAVEIQHQRFRPLRYLLEGNVRRLGDKIEVNAQLISTDTGAHVWADRFDGALSPLAALVSCWASVADVFCPAERAYSRRSSKARNPPRSCFGQRV